MEFGTLESSDERGCIYYFCVDPSSPRHPSPENVQKYYILTRVRSLERAFCFLCSLICDLSDSHRMQQLYKLYQTCVEKVPFNVFFELVRSYAQCPAPTVGAEQSGQIVVPALFRDEMTAKGALRKLPFHSALPFYSHKKGVMQPCSATPEKTALLPTEVPIAHPDSSGSVSTSPTASMRSGDEAMSSIVGASQPYAVFSLEAAGLRDLWERINVNSEKQKEVNRGEAERLQRCNKREETRVPANNTSGRDASVAAALDTPMEEGTQNNNNTSAAHMGRTKHPLRIEKYHSRTGDEARACAMPVKSPDSELVSMLKSQLRAKELELASERQGRRDERISFQGQIASFETKLQEISSAHGEVLYKLVRENKETVDRLEADMARKEEELHRIYDVRVQDRDVRIVELAESVRALEKQNQELERQMGDFAELQSYVREWESCYSVARSEYAKVLDHNEKLRGDLARTQLLVGQQQQQLLAAGSSMQKMQNGLAMVRGEIPHLLKSMLFTTPANANATAS